MNTPNRLTVARIVMSPIFLLLAVVEFPYHYACALAVFIAAALTDLFDGRIARRQGLVTNFGKFLDPLADKMLTTAAFLAFMVCPHTNASAVWAVMLVLSREFMVTSVRLLAAKDGVVVAASFAGKLKTVAQFTAIITMLLALEFSSWQSGILMRFALPAPVYNVPVTVAWVLVWVSVALTMISGFQYVWALRRYFSDAER